jgi:hypothetical protein
MSLVGKPCEKTGKQPMVTKGFANVPLDSPGLGIELNDEEVKKHLHPKAPGYFEPTPEWNDKRRMTGCGAEFHLCNSASCLLWQQLYAMMIILINHYH